MSRLFSGDLFGINWFKPSFMAPYNNFYPFTMTAGKQGRAMNNFAFLGHWQNRCGKIYLRQLVLHAPTVVLLVWFVLNPDSWQMNQFYYWATRQQIPDAVQSQKKKTDEWMARNKIYMLKHHYGMVSIPGTEKFVSD